MKSIFVFLCVVAAASAYKRVCYYASWRIYRPNYAKFTPEDIDPTLCTHIMYSFGYVSGNDLTPSDSWADVGLEGYSKVIGLKQQNADLKVYLAVGGAKEVQRQAFKAMAASQSNRRTFISNAIKYLKKYGFDGMDYDWEFPKENKADFADLVKETYEAFQAAGLGLSAAVSAYHKTIDLAYDVPTIASNIDFINLMAYDMHGYWDGVTGHHAGLYERAGETGEAATFNVDYGAQYWVSKGLPADKLIIGVGAYGKTWTLSGSNTGLGAPGGIGLKGPLCEGEAFLSYFEICDALKTGSDSWDSTAKVPYAHYPYQGTTQWISYDNEKSIQIKMDYIKSNGYGGGMVWTLNDDDFKGEKCGSKYPIISLLKSNLPADGDSGVTSTDAPAATTPSAITSSTFETTIETSTQASAGTTEAITAGTTAGTTAGPTTESTSGTTTGTGQGTTTASGGSSGDSFCQGRGSGLYAEPSDNTVYWQCWNDQGTLRPCGVGTVWLDCIKTCGYEGSFC